MQEYGTSIRIGDVVFVLPEDALYVEKMLSLNH